MEVFCGVKVEVSDHILFQENTRPTKCWFCLSLPGIFLVQYFLVFLEKERAKKKKKIKTKKDEKHFA